MQTKTKAPKGRELPEPVVYRTRTQDEPTPVVDTLPDTLAAALALQKQINALPDTDRTRGARLRRVGEHVRKLSHTPEPPTISFPELRQHFSKFPEVTDTDIAEARKRLLKKK
jgi:hypothetical protein